MGSEVTYNNTSISQPFGLNIRPKIEGAKTDKTSVAHADAKLKELQIADRKAAEAKVQSNASRLTTAGTTAQIQQADPTRSLSPTVLAILAEHSAKYKTSGGASHPDAKGPNGAAKLAHNIRSMMPQTQPISAYKKGA